MKSKLISEHIQQKQSCPTNIPFHFEICLILEVKWIACYTFWSKNRLPSEHNLQNQPFPPTEEPELTGKLLGMEMQPLHRSADQSDPHGRCLLMERVSMATGPQTKHADPLTGEQSAPNTTPLQRWRCYNKETDCPQQPLSQGHESTC